MSEPARTSARAALVESIPVGLEDLRATPGVQYTEDTLVRLTTEAQSTIDLTAMYWAWPQTPHRPLSNGLMVTEVGRV